jgi:hypothetical protein
MYQCNLDSPESASLRFEITATNEFDRCPDPNDNRFTVGMNQVTSKVNDPDALSCYARSTTDPLLMQSAFIIRDVDHSIHPEMKEPWSILSDGSMTITARFKALIPLEVLIVHFSVYAIRFKDNIVSVVGCLFGFIELKLLTEYLLGTAKQKMKKRKASPEKSSV